MFKFQEGEVVSLASDESMSRFKAGDRGVIWAQYTTEPPAYEVNFRDAEGKEFGAVVYEHELAAVTATPAVAPALIKSMA